MEVRLADAVPAAGEPPEPSPGDATPAAEPTLEGLGSGPAAGFGVRVILVDLASGRALLRRSGPCADPRGILEGKRAVLGLLQDATGGTFED